MMPTQPAAAATPAPIHDIAGPVWIFPYPVWGVIGAGVLLLVLLGVAVWFLRRKPGPRILTAKQRALNAIAAFRAKGAEADAYEFGVKVSDALRTYIRDQYGVDAVTRTSVEFLDVIRANAVFSANEKAAISEFLESVDLLKFARQTAGVEEITQLLDIAERVVNGEPAGASTK